MFWDKLRHNKTLSTKTVKLIVGLGNPGQAYSGNRHNIGFMCVSYFAREYHILFNKKKGNSRVGEGEIDGIQVTLARPQTYMNASGEAVSSLLRKLKLDLNDLIVIHDDLDLQVGRIRIRLGGSSGGHKGIGSIIRDVGGPDFMRIRVGIGRPSKTEVAEQNEKDVIGYVLSDFTADERALIEKTIPRVSEAIRSLIIDGLEAAMNRYNSMPASDSSEEGSSPKN
jgi:PTH1 family peptidyl-tRNA hydrolase